MTTAPERAIRRSQHRALLVLAVLAILIATLRPGGTTMPQGWSFDISSGEAAVAEAIQNLLLFIPLGIGLVLNGVRPLRAILLGAGLSFSVEFAQQYIPGRDPSVGDITMNTISTAIGVALARFAPRWLTVSPRQSSWQVLATVMTAGAVWLVTGLLLRPLIPPPPYRDVWTPNFSQWGHYRGRVLAASWGVVALTQRSFTTDSRTPGSRPGLENLTAALRVTAIGASRPPGRIAPLVAILDQHGTKVYVVAVDGTDLALRYHTRAAVLTLEQPDMRWRHKLDGIAPGDTFAVQAWRGERGSCLTFNSDRRCGLGYTIGDGWKLIFYPERWPGVVLGTLNSLWLAGWMLGVGYWGRRATAVEGGEVRRRRRTAAALAFAIGALVVVPIVTGLNTTPLHEWLGFAGGLAVGYWIDSRTLHNPI